MYMVVVMEKCKNCIKSTHRTEDEKSQLKNRLKIVEGQIRGIIGMVEDDRYCSDVLTQLLAVNKSIKSISNEVLKSHLKSCVVDDIQNGQLDVIDEVVDLIGRLV